MEQPTAEMQFGRDDDTALFHAETFSDGSLHIVITDINRRASYPFELGQSIHLRDFLNRHIDHFALAATGSLAERSSDDPAQLASVEIVPAAVVGNRQVWEPVPFQVATDSPPHKREYPPGELPYEDD